MTAQHDALSQPRREQRGHADANLGGQGAEEFAQMSVARFVQRRQGAIANR